MNRFQRSVRHKLQDLCTMMSQNELASILRLVALPWVLNANGTWTRSDIEGNYVAGPLKSKERVDSDNNLKALGFTLI